MFTYQHTVQYHETDAMGITHHANYVKWMEEARMAFLDAHGVSFRGIEESGVTVPVKSISIDYKKPTSYGDTVAIETAVAAYDGVTVTFSYSMTCGDSLIAEASSRHCFLKDGRLYAPRRARDALSDILQSLVDEKP